MARWVRDEVLNQPADFVDFLMNDYLMKNGFKQTERKGEQVWKEGDGYFSMARFLKYSYINGVLHLEAWVGLFRENALKGFAGQPSQKSFTAKAWRSCCACSISRFRKTVWTRRASPLWCRCRITQDRLCRLWCWASWESRLGF